MTTQSNMVFGVTLILMLNFVFYLATPAINSYGLSNNPDFGRNASLIDGYTESQTDPAGQLPNIAQDVETEGDGGFFTDIFNSVKSFFGTAGAGLSFLNAFLTALPSFLRAIGLPSIITTAVSAFWYGSALLIFVSFMWGRG